MVLTLIACVRRMKDKGISIPIRQSDNSPNKIHHHSFLIRLKKSLKVVVDLGTTATLGISLPPLFGS